MPITQYNSSVRQMSQSKFDSMKNASGKIPDLANQIVMTNSEDTNISCLRTEVVYDMTSSDASKNWGYPNGIGTGVTINKDFSKYDFLVCEYLSYNNSIVGFCDLSQPTMPSDTTGRYMIYAVAYIGNAYSELISVIDLNKSSLTTYLPGSGTVAVKIAKIYGVLKTPSMIYTGDELIAGNGISIENGVISSHNTHNVLWSGSKTDTGDITLSDDLSNYDLLILTGLNSSNEVCSFCVITSTISSYTDVNRPYDMGNNTYDINRYCNIYYKSQRTLSVKSIGNMTLKFVEGVR